MKAVSRTEYGKTEVLDIIETDVPVINDNEILVKVHATTINRTDCAILQGKPLIMHFVTGFIKPKRKIPGTDFAGVVTQAGSKITRFKPGDRVWGFDDSGLSSQAQFMAIPVHKAIHIIPASLHFQQAVACAEGAHYACNFINKVKLKAGQKAIVNGGGGAIGSAIIQLLKYFDVQVTAVCKQSQVADMQRLGADKIMDYTKEDFTLAQGQYDYVFDTVGKSTFGRCKRLLQPNGVYISSEFGPYAQNAFFSLFTPLFGKKLVKFPMPSNVLKSLHFIAELVEEKKFQPLIDRSFPMEQAREAYTYVLSGQKSGNVILDIAGT